MQRQRNELDLFPDTIDLNQGSPSNADTIDQMETQFPSISLTIAASNETAPSFSRWAHGESSSSRFNPQDESFNEVSKSRLGWPSSSSYSPSSSSESWFFEPVNIMTSSTVHHDAVIPQSSLNTSQNHGHVTEGEISQRHVLGAVLPHNIYKSGHQENEQIPSFYPSSSSNHGNCNNLLEHSDAWGGFSCKRKVAEGTSGSSSSNQLAGKNVMQHHGPTSYNNGPGNLIISSAPLSPSTINRSEPQSTSARIFSSRSNLGQDSPVSSSYSSFGARRVQEHPSRPVSTALRIEANSSLGYPSSPPWNGSIRSQHGSSSSSPHLPTNVSESEARNNVLGDQIDWSFAPETSSTGTRPYGSRGGSSSNNAVVRGSSSSSSWLPHHYRQHHHQNHHQRFSEAAPWVRYPRMDSEVGGNNSNNNGGGSSSSNNRRSHFGFVPSSSSNEAGSSSSRARRHLDQRSAAALLMDISGDDFDGWHAITAVEERHRLIRQVLNAMRRGVQLQAEDYMVFDPYMEEFAEMHDRHRDMRLDVDNMSYEELLALEETIGNVSTGLSEEKITASIKQRKHNNSMETTKNSEPCCICQEEYVANDAIGVLDCGHEFHTRCIKQWLTQKNLCPICKMTALET